VPAKYEHDEETQRALKHLGEVLRNWREEFGLAQADLGKVLGLSHQRIGDFEAGRSFIISKHWSQLARRFGYSVTELLQEWVRRAKVIAGEQPSEFDQILIILRAATEKDAMVPTRALEDIIKKYGNSSEKQ
jgi:transcriptional regulator with XRE-family HTH domain